MNRYEYTISPEQLDRAGLATVPSLYKLAIDSIGLNIRKEGFGVDVLAGRGLTWALARCAIEIYKRPALYDRVSVDVWRGEYQGLCYDRCIRVLDGRGELICHGVTDWCVINKNSRRPEPLPFVTGTDSERQPCEPARRLKPFTSLMKRTRQVGYSECDFNGHLNNSRYVEMFYDMLPQPFIEAMRRIRLDVNFRREILCGSQVEAYVSECGAGSYEYCLYHDGAPACCAAVTAR